MAVVSGDIEEIRYNHPTIGSGVLFPKAGEDSMFDPGGYRNNDDKNQIDGGGRNIKQMNRSKWRLECVVTNDMNTADDLDKLDQLAANPVDATWTITHSNKTVWGGTGCPVGDVQANGNTGVINLVLAGGGKLKKVVG